MLVQLEQGSEAWLQWRRQGLGASDAPAIMGDSLYLTPYALWQIKTGRRPEPSLNSAMSHGLKTEQEAREAFGRQTGRLAPPCCMQAAEDGDPLSFLRCSLDGLTEDGEPVEIKCMVEIRDHLTAREGQVPRHYYAQPQHELLVSGAERGYYWSYFKPDSEPGEGVLVPVARDEDYIAGQLVPALKEFWRWVGENCFPVPVGTADLSGDPNWCRAVEAWRDAKVMLEKAERFEHAQRQAVERLAQAGKTVGAGVSASWGFRRGEIAWRELPGVAAILKSLGKRVDEYRSAESLVLTIRRTK